MYIAYGWPKVLRALSDSESHEVIVSVSLGGSFIVVVSSTVIQVWTAGQYRVKVGEYKRDPESLEADGHNILAHWNASVETLCVVTAKNLLHFYDVNVIGKPLKVGGLEGSRQQLQAVRVKYRSTTPVPLFVDGVTINACVADDLTIVLGTSDGHLHAISWRGQVRGSASLWKETGQEIAGPMYLSEANNIPQTPMSPANGLFSPVPPLMNGLRLSRDFPGMSGGIANLEYVEALRLLVAVLIDGRVLLCGCGEKGLRPVEDVFPEKWVGVMDAVCTAVGSTQQVLAVGSRRGTVELFNLADNTAHLRTISLFDWGYQVDDTGPVNCISWTPDNWALAVGWRQRGLAVWSVSGCRLMCTIRQGSMSNVLPMSPAHSTGAPVLSTEPMVGGVSMLAWAEYAYQLIAVESGVSSRMVQFPFAKGCIGRGMAGSSHVWQLLQAEDRVLLVQSDEEDELKLHHLVLPRTYIEANWPLLHVAANEDGSYLALAGQRGVVLYNLRAKRWRVFGDIVQERQVRCVGLLWLGKIIVICNHREATNTYEMSLYPRYHLDESSLLFRQPLIDRPVALDTWQDYVLVATPPFDIRVYHVQLEGELSPLGRPVIQLRTVRELSIMSARKPPVAMRFVPRTTTATTAAAPSADRAEAREAESTPLEEASNGGGGSSSTRSSGEAGSPVGAAAGGGGGGGGGGGVARRDSLNEAVLRQPTKCMLLRTNGELAVLDLDRGSERALVSGVEHFWLSTGRGNEEGAVLPEVPWWAYGHRGMQVWYPSSAADTLTPSDQVHQLDPELDFDREVYPLGVSPAAGVIVGISQRLSLSSCANMPCFEPTPQAQPILPCLLRHLLQRNAIDEAYQLARLSAARPHFSHSLEWLLFTVFDAEMSNASVRKRLLRKLNNGSSALPNNFEPSRPLMPMPAPILGISLLERACQLIRRFPEYLDVVVSVARKTDSRHWAELFAAAGNSTMLFEECFEKKQYRTATCYILVIEKLEGPTVSQQSALRLLQATLHVSLYELAGELVRFLLRSGREYSTTASVKEEPKHNESLIKSFFSFGFTSAAPKVRADVLHATVKHILGDHAMGLMGRRELRELASFVRGTQFDLKEFLQSPRGKNVRLDDFPTALRIFRIKLGGGDDPQAREEAEFLLSHMMQVVGFREWSVVLATLLRNRKALVELFQSDMRLWKAYSTALRNQPNARQYEELLTGLEEMMAASIPNGEEGSKEKEAAAVTVKKTLITDNVVR